MSNGFQKNFWRGRIFGPDRAPGGYHDGVRVARPRRRARRFNGPSTVCLAGQSWAAPNSVTALWLTPALAPSSPALVRSTDRAREGSINVSVPSVFAGHHEWWWRRGVGYPFHLARPPDQRIRCATTDRSGCQHHQRSGPDGRSAHGPLRPRPKPQRNGPELLRIGPPPPSRQDPTRPPRPAATPYRY